MEYRSSEYKAGLFIFISGVLLVAMVFFLGGLQNSFEPQKKIHIVFDATGDLNPGAPIRVAGLKVGKVAEIHRLGEDSENSQVRVLAKIKATVPLKKDSVAAVKIAAVPGGKPFVEIFPGSPDAKPLMEGEQLLGIEPVAHADAGAMMEDMILQMKRLTAVAEGLTSESRETIKTFQTSLDKVETLLVQNREETQSNMKNLLDVSSQLALVFKQNGNSLGDTVDGIASVAAKADSLLEAKEKRLAALLKKAGTLTWKLDVLLQENQEDLAQLVTVLNTDVQKTLENIRLASSSLDQALQQNEQGRLENRRNLLELIKNLNESSQNLKALTNDLGQNSFRLAGEPPQKKTLYRGEPLPVYPPGEFRMQRLDKISSK